MQICCNAIICDMSRRNYIVFYTWWQSFSVNDACSDQTKDLCLACLITRHYISWMSLTSIDLNLTKSCRGKRRYTPDPNKFGIVGTRFGQMWRQISINECLKHHLESCGNSQHTPEYKPTVEFRPLQHILLYIRHISYYGCSNCITLKHDNHSCLYLSRLALKSTRKIVVEAKPER